MVAVVESNTPMDTQALKKQKVVHADASARPSSDDAFHMSTFPDKVSTILTKYLSTLEDQSQPVVRLKSPAELDQCFKDESGVSLKFADVEEAHGEENILQACESTLRYSLRTGHPLFFNQLYGRVDPVAMAGDWLTTAANTNVHTFEVAPVFTAVEKEVLSKVARVVGPSYAKEHDGLFVPGGSISNLYGMHLARNRADPDFAKRGAHGGPRCVAFTSIASHYSYLKCARLTGVGSDNLISVAVDDKGGMCSVALEAAVKKCLEEGGKPFFVGTTAGTTVQGAFDPFVKIAEVCAKYGMWMHVDGCWGGSAMLSRKYKHQVEGIDRADSFAWNPHKMMGMPLQCSVFITRHAGILAECNGTKASYLFQPDKNFTEYDVGDKTIQCGRKADMFKLWLAWKAYGDKGLEARVDRCMAITDHFTEKVNNSNGKFRLAYQPTGANVCFWYYPPSMRPFPADLKDASAEQIAKLAKVAPQIKDRMQRKGDSLIGFQPLEGKPNFFRIVFPNMWNVTTGDIDALMERMDQIGQDL